MKKTIVAVMVMVLGLSLTAWALPPVTLDGTCAYVDTLTGQYIDFMAVIDDSLDANLTDLESVSYDGEDFVWGAGLPDVCKYSLLGAAMCADSTLADDFAANKDQFLAEFVDDLDALVTWGGDAQAPIVAGGDAVATMFAIPGVADGLPAFLTAMAAVPPYDELLTPEIQGLIIAMCTDSGHTVLLYDEDEDGWVEDSGDLPAYLPDLCPIVADILETDVATGDDSAYGYAMALRFLYPDALTAMLSVSTTSAAVFSAFVEGDLLADFRDYVPLFEQISQVFTVIAGYATNLTLDPATIIAPLGGAAAAFQGGADAIDALAMPALPILGVVTKAPEDEPFGNQGDYDGNGANNIDTYNSVADEGVAKFVAAASGADPWYGANPDMPAAGLVGLAALVGAFAAGGAFVLRKK